MDHDTVLSEWVRMYTERLVRIAYSYVKNQATAEDRVQDAFLKAYSSYHQLKDVENAMPWLVRIVINECKTARRKSWREIVGFTLPDRLESSAEDEFFRKTEFHNIHVAVLSLHEKYRIPIVLFHFEGLSVQEISDILSIKIGTVKTRLARGRHHLQKKLERCENDGSGRETSRGKTI